MYILLSNKPCVRHIIFIQILWLALFFGKLGISSLLYVRNYNFSAFNCNLKMGMATGTSFFTLCNLQVSLMVMQVSRKKSIGVTKVISSVKSLNMDSYPSEIGVFYFKIILLLRTPPPFFFIPGSCTVQGRAVLLAPILSLSPSLVIFFSIKFKIILGGILTVLCLFFAY